MEGWTVDVRQWGDALIYASMLSAALFGLWKMWFKRVVDWVRDQGETNNAVARVITQELPKMTKAIERVSETQRDHGKKLDDLDHRVANIEGGAIAGGFMQPQEPPLTPDVRRRTRRTTE